MTPGVTGTLVTCGTGLGVYGTPQVLITSSAMPYQAIGLLVNVWEVIGGAATAAISIGPAAGQDIISHLMVQPPAASTGMYSIYFPVSIPPLTQIGVAGTAAAACTMFVSSIAIGGGSAAASPLNAVETMSSMVSSGYQGIGWTFAAAGVESTPGGPGTALGTTTRPMRNMIIVFGCNGDASRANIRYFVNIYADGTLYIENLVVQTNSNGDDMRPSHIGPLPVALPAGVALSATVRRHTALGNDLSFRMMIYGVS